MDVFKIGQRVIGNNGRGTVVAVLDSDRIKIVWDDGSTTTLPSAALRFVGQVAS